MEKTGIWECEDCGKVEYSEFPPQECSECWKTNSFIEVPEEMAARLEDKVLSKIKHDDNGKEDEDDEFE